MNVTILDHLFGLLLVLPLPLFGAWQFRRLKERIARGDRDARIRQYRDVIVEEALLVGAVVAIWTTGDRALSALAPADPATAAWTWVGWGATVILCLFLILQAVAVARSEENLASVLKQLEKVTEFLPRTRRELYTFWALSVAAGVGEEIVFRGWAMAWVGAVATAGLGLGGGASLAAAALGSSVVFGLAHTYQGPSGMVRTGAVGLLLAGLAVATGGLLAPMIVHTVMDVTSGLLAQRALQAEQENEPTPAGAVETG